MPTRGRRRAPKHLLLVAFLALAAALGCESIRSTGSERWSEEYSAAQVAIRAGDTEAAHQHLDRALRASDSSIPMLQYLHAITLEQVAWLADREGRLDDAIAALDGATALRPIRGRFFPWEMSFGERRNSALWAIGLAANLAGRGRVEEGERIHDRYAAIIAYLEKLMELSSSYASPARLARASGHMAMVLVAVEEPGRSLRHFQSSFDRQPVGDPIEIPEQVGIFYFYAQALEDLGRPEEAAAQRALVREADLGRDYLDQIKRVYDEGAYRTWEPSELPFRVYIAEPPPELLGPGPELIELTRAAALEWAGRVRPGVPSFQWVEQPEDSHITVGWKSAFVDEPGKLGHAISRTGYERARILRVDIEVGLGPPDASVPFDSLRWTIVHEFGHAIGLQGHSPSPFDLMFPMPLPERQMISERDVETLRHLFPCAWDSGPGLVVLRQPEASLRCQ